jgi:hypothetical protein
MLPQGHFHHLVQSLHHLQVVVPHLSKLGGQNDTLADVLEKAFDTMLPLDKITVDIMAKKTNECLFIGIKLPWKIYTLILIQQL